MLNMKNILYSSLIAISSLGAQTPALVKDINPTGDSWGEFLDYTLTNGNKLLSANDGVHGAELWTTDGTANGTKLLKDINPNGDAFVGTEFITFKDELYFFADDGIHGAELWKTNGTASGTKLVKDIKQTGGQIDPDKTNFIAIGDKFYFVAEDDTHGNEIWESDGTDTGTKMVIDLNPSGSINSQGQIHLHSLSNSLIFVGRYKNQDKLWKVSTSGDSTALMSVPERSSTSQSFVFEGRLYLSLGYFVNSSSTHRLYVTDGTLSGTSLFKQFYINGNFANYQNDLYLIGDNSDQLSTCNLWKISSKTNDLTLIKQISTQQNIYGIGMYNVGGKMLFFAEHDTLGYVLYSSDGTVQGTKILHDFDSKVTGELSDYFAPSHYLNEELYISAKVDSTNYSLFKTNGEQVQFLHDFNPEEGSGYAWSFGTIKNQLFIIADGEGVGLELFKFDGTTNFSDDLFNDNSVMYPNPAQDQLHISKPDIEHIKIIDLAGKTVIDQSINGNTPIIDISKLNKGIYMIELRSENGNAVVSKFVKS
jgi:ELWxxDGT repeat protein